MKVIKILAYLFIGFIGLFVFFAAFGGNDREEEEKALREKHCAIVWDEIGAEEKEAVLREFIGNNGIEPENRKPVGMLALELLERSVKYPETIRIDGDEPQYSIYFGRGKASIKDVETGLMTFHEDFIAKNKLNMDVRMQMQMDVRYTAGCEEFDVVDFRVE